MPLKLAGWGKYLSTRFQSQGKKILITLDLTVILISSLFQLIWDHISCFLKQDDNRGVPKTGFLISNGESPLCIKQCVWQPWQKLCWRSLTESPLLLHFSLFKPSWELLCYQNKHLICSVIFSTLLFILAIQYSSTTTLRKGTPQGCLGWTAHMTNMTTIL